MNRYYECLRFFCKTTLDENDKVLFTEDGRFTITTAEGVVSLYSSTAELIQTYENAFVLDNGCICVKKSGSIDIYYDGKPMHPIIFDSGTALKIRVLTNAIALSDEKNKKETVYFISPNSKVYRFFRLKKGVRAESTSVNGMVLTCKQVALSPDEKILYDQDGKTLNLPPFYLVDFLPCGSYIVHFYDMSGCSMVVDGCALYNASHQKLLHAEQSCQILQLGDKVVYEQALIIAPENGRIISEYKGEKAVYGGSHIFAHSIYSGSCGKLWIGGNMQAVMKDGDLRALYYRKDGHIYFAPQVGYTKKDICALKNYVSDIYLERIKEILP